MDFVVVALRSLGFPATAAFVAFRMALSVAWPFEPLDHRSWQIELSNGDLIRIEGDEDRGWHSDGSLWRASFR
jgi:hypothetical protein